MIVFGKVFGSDTLVCQLSYALLLGTNCLPTEGSPIGHSVFENGSEKPGLARLEQLDFNFDSPIPFLPSFALSDENTPTSPLRSIYNDISHPEGGDPQRCGPEYAFPEEYVLDHVSNHHKGSLFPEYQTMGHEIQTPWSSEVVHPTFKPQIDSYDGILTLEAEAMNRHDQGEAFQEGNLTEHLFRYHNTYHCLENQAIENVNQRSWGSEGLNHILDPLMHNYDVNSLPEAEAIQGTGPFPRGLITDYSPKQFREVSLLENHGKTLETEDSWFSAVKNHSFDSPLDSDLIDSFKTTGLKPGGTCQETCYPWGHLNWEYPNLSSVSEIDFTECGILYPPHSPQRTLCSKQIYEPIGISDPFKFLSTKDKTLQSLPIQDPGIEYKNDEFLTSYMKSQFTRSDQVGELNFSAKNIFNCMDSSPIHKDPMELPPPHSKKRSRLDEDHPSKKKKNRKQLKSKKSEVKHKAHLKQGKIPLSEAFMGHYQFGELPKRYGLSQEDTPVVMDISEKDQTHPESQNCGNKESRNHINKGVSCTLKSDRTLQEKISKTEFQERMKKIFSRCNLTLEKDKDVLRKCRIMLKSTLTKVGMESRLNVPEPIVLLPNGNFQCSISLFSLFQQFLNKNDKIHEPSVLETQERIMNYKAFYHTSRYLEGTEAGEVFHSILKESIYTSRKKNAIILYFSSINHFFQNSLYEIFRKLERRWLEHMAQISPRHGSQGEEILRSWFECVRRSTLCSLYQIDLLYRLCGPSITEDIKISKENALNEALINFDTLWMEFPFYEDTQIITSESNYFFSNTIISLIKRSKTHHGSLPVELRVSRILLSAWCLKKLPETFLALKENKHPILVRSFFVFLEDCAWVDYCTMARKKASTLGMKN